MPNQVPIDTFLTQVNEIFTKANESHTTIRFSIKRLIEVLPVEGNPEYDISSNPTGDVSKMSINTEIPKNASANAYSLLIRVSCGSGVKKIKYSTIVQPDELDKFWQEYVSIVKPSMIGLIKKKKKTKARNKLKKSAK